MQRRIANYFWHIQHEWRNISHKTWRARANLVLVFFHCYLHFLRDRGTGKYHTRIRSIPKVFGDPFYPDDRFTCGAYQ